MKGLERYGNAALVLVLLVGAEIAVLAEGVEGSRAALLLFPFAWTLPLLVRHRHPAAATLAVLGSLALESLVVQEGAESIMALPPVILAFWTAGTIADRSRALAVGGLGLALGVVVVAANPGPLAVSDAVFITVVSVGPFAAGAITRERERRATALLHDAAATAREREARLHAAVAAERAQIGRDLHDVVGHAISVMTVQAGAARMLLANEPLRAEAPLLAVEETGRQALGEMRRMLEVLRETDGAPVQGSQRGLSDLGGLVQQVRDSGVPVELEIVGEPAELAPGVELAAYRIVQEALTNVLKHARDARARVRIRYGREALELQVDNDGALASTPTVEGRGLVGMRERVSLYRGELRAGPCDGGGFSVEARLPLGSENA